MNTQHHTPDTWSYGEDNDSWYVSVGDTQIAYGLSEENACHIVACVDACAGIVNPDIKIPKLQEALIEAVEQLQKAEQHNAELMASCESFRDSVLHQRWNLEDNGMTSDQINDVLNLFDTLVGDEIAKAGVK